MLATLAAKPPARLLFEEKAGLVPVEVLTGQGKVVGAELTSPQPLKKSSQVSAEQAASCLSLSAADVKTDRHPPLVASVGLPFLMVEVASREALRRARPGAEGFANVLPGIGTDAVYFYTRDVPAAEQPLDLQARMFHPGASGLSEDPATGSATAAAAALLADLDSTRDGELKLRIGQGVDMGRPSLLLTRVRKANGAVTSAHVGGGCVQMMEGTFRWRERGELHLPPRQILHLHPVALLDDLGDPLPVTLRMVALVAEDAHGAGFLHQRGELVEFFPGLRRLEMF